MLITCTRRRRIYLDQSTWLLQREEWITEPWITRGFTGVLQLIWHRNRNTITRIHDIYHKLQIWGQLISVSCSNDYKDPYSIIAWSSTLHFMLHHRVMNLWWKVESTKRRMGFIRSTRAVLQPSECTYPAFFHWIQGKGRMRLRPLQVLLWRVVLDPE